MKTLISMVTLVFKDDMAENNLVTIKPERLLEVCAERTKQGGGSLTLLAKQLVSLASWMYSKI